ncbi:MAG TPA: SDR family NAD(P)-dependent oxidoreductase [Caldimonas sp.]|nr:SDR family NAD(P)-dependent oxidoreductase [Caldimonas sp.]HEX4234164.1 SDR family NAD(P)-dependent oxidoreductase [Caldimonas sp.]
MDLQLGAKRALITGGSRGIGKAIARALAREGAHVAILARDPVRLAAAASEIAAESGRTIVPVAADTTDQAQVEAAVAAAARTLGGGIDILVAAAAEPGGYAPPPKLAEIDAAHFHREMDTKVMGYVRCARAVAPHMRERRWGRIILVSGLAARHTGNTVGSIRNVAVAALAKNLADELGPDGVNVNVVHPGVTRTERTAALIEAQVAALGVDAREVERRIADGNSIRHFVDAAEVADIVAFLASPRSLAINGESIAVGGGVPRSIYY